MDDERYPVPAQYPRYEGAPAKVAAGRRVSVWAVIDSAFIFVALVLATWLAVVLVAGSIRLSWRTLAFTALLWLVLSYLLLPRLHQIFSLIYVPDYFIGRTKTYDGMLGDPVNLAFDGSEADIHMAMRSAGWRQSDRVTLRSAWRIVVSSVFSRSYPSAPVSDLYLFGRPQDFSYQQQVDANPKQRHHVRFWRVPTGWVLPGGHRAAWLAAASYDRSVRLSIFTFQVTHKIDEAVDVERDYLLATLRFTDPKVRIRVIEDFSTAYHHRNGGGDRVRTDGHLPVADVSGAAERGIDRFHAVISPPSCERSQVGDHGVPPMSLIATGGLFLLHLLTVIGYWWVVWGDLGVSVGLAWFRHWEAVALSFAVVVELALWVAMLRRSAVARVALMCFSTVEAVHSLIWLTVDPLAPLRSVLMTAFAVTVVLITSGNSARQWVQGGLRRGKATS